MKVKITIIICLLFNHISVLGNETLLNRGNGSEPDSLNIHMAEGLNSHNVLRDLYEGLMTLDQQGLPIYGAALSHTVENNTWTFILRSDAKWSDGSAVVAADFIRGWRKAIDPETAAPYAFLMDNIIHAKKILQLKLTPDNLAIKALDDHTLEIRLWKPDSAFLEKLSLPIFYPLPKSEIKDRKIISNGPYQLSNWTVQEKISLTKNPYYYANDSVYFDRVNYWVTENQSSELKRFRAGELDITESIPDSQISWIRENLNSQLRIFPYLGSFFLGLNVSDKNLNNLFLRQALSLAIDRDILTEKVLKTGQQPAYHIVPRSLINQESKINTSTASERIDKAQKSLKQSGVNIHDLTIEILYNNSDNQRKVALAIAAMWRQNLGIRAKLLNQEWKVFVQSRKSKKRQAFRSGWIADYADALSFLELFTTNSRFNFYQYSNPGFDKLVESIKQEPNKKIKNSKIEQAEDLLLNDIPVIPLYYYVSRHMVNDAIEGYSDNVADRHLSKYLYRKEK
ncbi:MAG: peptide ABC transporter substrate-binding protein [Marinicellaceae bacterium]